MTSRITCPRTGLECGRFGYCQDCTLPTFDQASFDRMTEKGAKAWKDVPSASAWVEEMRGNGPPTQPPVKQPAPDSSRRSLQMFAVVILVVMSVCTAAMLLGLVLGVLDGLKWL